MKIYLVILEDRHTDVQVEAFGNEVDALKRAQEITRRYPDYEVEDCNNPTWLYNATLTSESDYIRVEEVELK